MEKKTQVRNTLLLVLAALIWGCSNVSQAVGAEYVGTFTFLAFRSILAGTVLLPVIWLRSKGKRKPAAQAPQPRQTLLYGGVLCGVCLFLASAVQQAGIAHTTPAKAGFITSLYTMFVPILSLFLGKRVGKKIWVCVGIGLVGLYLLCMTNAFSLSGWDAFLLICSFLFAAHILVVDHYAPQTDVIQLSCIQFYTVAAISTVLMLALEKPTAASLSGAAIPILYSGIVSSGIGFTLQIVGQRDLDPTIASLAMSLESVFTALAGYVILHQSLTAREMLGCLLMFGAIIAAQLPEHRRVNAMALRVGKHTA